ncbi:MAG: single-stranded DNA-binding protein [Lachnospiraceae bacterium]|nr:single-stranded DNA-binding protein [Lachnospiraceae bacterium]
MNKVILMGRLTREPEIRYSGGDNSLAIARYSIAVDRRFRRQGDQTDADFFNCTAFGKLAEFVERYLHQGTKIVMTGRIQNDNYTNREGQRVFSVQIIAEEIEFAESKNAQASAGGYTGGNGYNGNNQAGGYQAPAQNRPAPAQAAPAPMDGGFMNIPDSVDDEDLPFN